MAFIPKPPFPNVPNLPGVPQVRRAVGGAINSLAPVLGAAAAVGSLWRALFSKPVWGIYKQEPKTETQNGVETVTVVADQLPVVSADSVLTFGYTNEQDIPAYPVEEGGYANYNEVNLPPESSVRLSKGGSENDRREFLDQIHGLFETLQFYKIVTPERTYNNVRPIRFDFSRRERNGAYFFTEVDLYFREMRIVTPEYTSTAVTTENARDISATPVDNRGTVNGQPVTSPPNLDGVVTQ